LGWKESLDSFERGHYLKTGCTLHLVTMRLREKASHTAGNMHYVTTITM